MALISILAFFSGPGAQGAIKNIPGVSEALIERHQGAAMLALLFMEFTGAFSLVALWKSQGESSPARWNWSLSAVLLLSIVTAGLMARVGTTGGDIRHPEIASGQEEATEGSTVSKMVRGFEPSPGKFAELMTASKWWWAFMMDLHFVGLALLIGTVGILNLRMLGFAKQIPIGSLAPLSAVGHGRVRHQSGNRRPGFYRHGSVLHLRLGFLDQDAGDYASGTECGGILLDRRIPIR